ncbi:hypothetical protein JNB84_22285 [Rhizobium pusense]|uniref:hypothetical protein n=1 Tax=Agrobacterium pusense TaxID=648995 RepID=UPI001C6F09F0|nr:hypothetical protein [Agrobacterium pusense]MBW9080696.1 hypothetical protein [Agrobacterium pusense]
MANARSSEGFTTEPSADEVYVQLERILSCDRVNLPERARRFLRFVVTETLEGRSIYLKAYTIADVVFGRRNFDAQSDPAVRIEAGRIRRELERYYLMAGPKEPVIISIPKGGYVPTFERGVVPDADPSSIEAGSDDVGFARVVREHENSKESGKSRVSVRAMVAIPFAIAAVAALGSFWHLGKEPSATGDGRASIAVGTFDHEIDDKDLARIAQGTSDEVITRLVKFDEIVVIDAVPGAPNSKSQSARYLLEGSLRKQGVKVRSNVRLIRQSDNAVIWASTYDTDLSVQTALEGEAAVAEKVAIAVAQPFGVLFSSDAGVTGGWEAYDCAQAYYSYRRLMTGDSLATAQNCLTSLTAKFPDDATSLAMLSLTKLDQVRFSYKLGSAPPKDGLDTALQLARRASQIDPQNARVLQALMLASFFTNDIPAALEAGAASYALNPNDTEVAGEYGLRLSMGGKWETGCDLVSKAVSQGAGPGGYYEVGMALCAFMRDDLQAAELWSRMSDLAYNPMHRMVLAAILGASGKTSQAQLEIQWLNKNAPALIPNVEREISTRLARPQDQEKILSGLRAAGVPLASKAASN